MNIRIKDKVREIERYLGELEEVLNIELEEYLKSFKYKAIYERYLEKIVESIVDLAFIVIKDNNFEIPEDDKNSFEILNIKDIISEKLSTKLKEAKGMRNIIAHEYGKIDDSLVFETIRTELIKDAAEFISSVKLFYKKVK